MAIVKMKKFALHTFENYKSGLLKELQKFEDVHFKNLAQDDMANLDFLNKVYSGEEVSRTESELAKVKFSISKIEAFIQKEKGLKGLTKARQTLSFEEFDTYTLSYDHNKAYEKIKELDEKIKSAKTEIAKLKSENDNLKDWLKLDISLAEMEKLKHTKYIVGTVSKITMDSFRESIESKFSCAYVEILGSIKEEVAVLIIAPNEDYEEINNFTKTVGLSKLSLGFKGIPKDIIKENSNKIDILQKTEEDAFSQVKNWASEYNQLQITHDYLKTDLERQKASENFLKMQTIILLEGWVPEEQISEFKSIISKVCGNDYYLEETAVSKDSTDVPIKLSNNKVVQAFEGVTSMYSMPKYGEVDPTPVLMPFYWLFFGFMIGDAGYGLIFVIGTFLALKYMDLNKGTEGFIRFFHYLGYGAIVAGIVTGSMFGFTFFAPIPVIENGVVIGHKAILDSGADIVLMIILSIIVGVVQIVFGLGVKGYILLRDGRPFAAIFDSLFWIITVLSGIGLIVGATGMIPPTAVEICKWSFIGSIIGLFLTQGRQSPTIAGKLGSGLYAVYGLSSYVGDIVSYTRIVALSLSGAYIALSFKIMAGLIPGDTFPGIILKYIAAAIILVLGGALNLGLSALGAYVHTCRLQYVEFFSKFYEGGGVPFKPFELKNTFIKIKK